MPIPLLIGAGSGLVSAALFASAATATALAGVLFYLAPLPLCLAGLGWGGMAALLLGAHRHGGDRREPRPGHGRGLRRVDRRADRAPHSSRAAVASSRHAARPASRRARMVSAGPHRRLGGADGGHARRPPGSVPRLRSGQLSRSRSARSSITAPSRSSIATARCSPRRTSPVSRPCSPARCPPPSPSSGSPSPCSICGWRG